MMKMALVLALTIFSIYSNPGFAVEQDPAAAPVDDETPEYKQILEREKIAPPRSPETTMTFENGLMGEKETDRAQEKEQERVIQDEVVEFYSPNWWQK